MSAIAAGLNIAAQDGRLTLRDVQDELPNMKSFGVMPRAVLKAYFAEREYQADKFEPAAKALFDQAMAGELKKADARFPSGWDRVRNFLGAPRDTDGDGLTDAEEVRRRTNRFVADTDGDGASDGFEVARGTNPGAAY